MRWRVPRAGAQRQTLERSLPIEKLSLLLYRISLRVVADLACNLCDALDFIGKPAEVFVQSIEDFALYRVCSEIADQRGLGSVAP